MTPALSLTSAREDCFRPTRVDLSINHSRIPIIKTCKHIITTSLSLVGRALLRRQNLQCCWTSSPEQSAAEPQTYIYIYMYIYIYTDFDKQKIDHH